MLGGSTYCAVVVNTGRRLPDGSTWGRWGFVRPLRHLAQIVPYSVHNHLEGVADVRFPSNSNYTTNVMVIRA
jgi:hypothetical protein